MAARSILEPLEICFSDLQLMSSHSPQLSPAELSRIESLTAAVMQALGPSGPGLLVITGVPRAPGLRRDLLPLARKIALLGRKDRARVLKAEDCSHISCCQQSSSPDAHAYLQLFDIKKNIIYFVRSPPESFIVQVGEAADILTRGKLCSTLHSVSRPTDIQNLSRETFVVFLQPAWDKVLSSSEFPCLDETSNQVERLARNVSSVPKEENAPTRPTISDSEDAPELMQEILEKIPPLSIRYKKEMTFAEFSRETTKQYYSSSGTQSTR
ncbi:uncharacterized protein LOC122010270 isoform X2 [Zingiber officinale]|uniref:uncharacterized protein LOC122010270 isoform X2 n=1 Tax=Zingiber officinale TaxID=94328 RepID=UPI001C4C8A2A|nr:uncharacterized protein LOC122010270 isoform X2 [Zingiber officinale]